MNEPPKYQTIISNLKNALTVDEMQKILIDAQHNIYMPYERDLSIKIDNPLLLSSKEKFNLVIYPNFLVSLFAQVDKEKFLTICSLWPYGESPNNEVSINPDTIRECVRYIKFIYKDSHITLRNGILTEIVNLLCPYCPNLDAPGVRLSILEECILQGNVNLFEDILNHGAAITPNVIKMIFDIECQGGSSIPFIALCAKNGYNFNTPIDIYPTTLALVYKSLPLIDEEIIINLLGHGADPFALINKSETFYGAIKSSWNNTKSYLYKLKDSYTKLSNLLDKLHIEQEAKIISQGVAPPPVQCKTQFLKI